MSQFIHSLVCATNTTVEKSEDFEQKQQSDKSKSSLEQVKKVAWFQIKAATIISSNRCKYAV